MHSSHSFTRLRLDTASAELTKRTLSSTGRISTWISCLFIICILHAPSVLAQTQTVPTITLTKTLVGTGTSVTVAATCLDGEYIDQVVSKLATQPVMSPPSFVGEKTVTTTVSVRPFKVSWSTITDVSPLTTTLAVNGEALTYVTWPEITVCADSAPVESIDTPKLSTSVTRVIVSRPGIAATAVATKSLAPAAQPVTRPGAPPTQAPAPQAPQAPQSPQDTSRVPVTRPGMPANPLPTPVPTESPDPTWEDDVEGDIFASDPTLPTDLSEPTTVLVTITYADATDATLPTVEAQLSVNSPRFSATYCKTMLSSAADAVQGSCLQICANFISTPQTASLATTRQQIASCNVLCEARTGGVPLSTSCDVLFTQIFYGITNATPVQTAAVTGLPTENGGAPTVLDGAELPEDGFLPIIEPNDVPAADNPNMIPISDAEEAPDTDPDLDELDPTLQDPGFVINIPKSTKKPVSTKTIAKTSAKTTAKSTKTVQAAVNTANSNALTKISRPTTSPLPKSSAPSMRPFGLVALFAFALL